MIEWEEETIQTTREFFEMTRSGFVKDSMGHFGIVNKSKEGNILITSCKDDSKIWNYESVESMIAMVG